jgi:hypothetical protein
MKPSRVKLDLGIPYVTIGVGVAYQLADCQWVLSCGKGFWYFLATAVFWPAPVAYMLVRLLR